MNDAALKEGLLALFDREIPAAFHDAVTDSLRRLDQPPRRMRVSARRLAILTALLALLLGAMAYAATRWRVFDALFGATPQNADQVMQSNLGITTVGDVDIIVREAGYDGMTLYVAFSYVMKDVDECLGMYRFGEAQSGCTSEDLELLNDHNVGWWIDQLWINGECVDMPCNSSETYSGSETPGELMVFQSWRLDNEGLYLPDGDVRVTLPIGERQDFMAYYETHTDAQGRLAEPDRGGVSFTLNTSMRGQVVVEEPCVRADLPSLWAQASRVVYTPILTYVTLDLEAKPEAWEAFVAEYGEGVTDESGEVLFAYTPLELYMDWIWNLQLVDGQGRPVEAQDDGFFVYGPSAVGDDGAEILLPYLEDPPAEMYLAPLTAQGVGDMSQAVRIR